MSHPGSLYQWHDLLASAFPDLNPAQQRGLAEFSYGMALARSASVTKVALQLSDLLGEKYDSTKQRLRDWYCPASAKAGRCRRQLDVRSCFAPLLKWILEDWPGKQLAIALDATALGERFTVLCISVVYKGCAVPVAWRILPANVPHPWKPEWLALLKEFRRVVPRDWTVIAMTDRGLYAKWLFQAIQRCSWHPFMRINNAGTFRPDGEKQRRPLQSFTATTGEQWAGRGQAFKDAPKRLQCTLLARRDEGYADPWLVLTDLPPESAEVCWYGLRSWIEQGFKRLKSGGWDWQKTHMSDPGRAERLWLAMAVATWWCLLVGGEAEESERPVETIGPLPRPAESARRGTPDERPSPKGPLDWGAGPVGEVTCPGGGESDLSTGARHAGDRPTPRAISVFQRGRTAIVNALIRDGTLLLGKTLPEPWPIHPPARVVSKVVP